MTHLALALSIGWITATLPPNLDADVETALGTAGLTPLTARYDPNLLRFFRSGEFTTPLFESAFEHPWRAPFLVETYRRQLATTVGQPENTLNLAGAMIGQGTRRSLLGDPIGSQKAFAQQSGSLDIVLAEMEGLGLIRGSLPSLQGVPSQTQEAAALVLRTALDRVGYRRAAFVSVGGIPELFALALGDALESDDPEVTKKRLGFYRTLDLKFLIAGAYDLTLAVNEASAKVRDLDQTVPYDWQVDTEWGLIRLTGGTASQHDPRPSMLIIDTGGADTYVRCASNQNPANWLSVVIDSAGNDTYVSHEALIETPVDQFADRAQNGEFGPAAGLFGYAFLFDLRGNDLYRTHRPGLGSGFVGVGMLYDAEGADRYDAYAAAQGFGQFGVGLLEDQAGSDEYRLFNSGQGHGKPGGMGVLLDRAGNDRYLANNEVLDFPSPQTDQANVSLAQGAGYGRRADYLDGQSLSGGIGLLYDVAGDDTYRCGVFGQGVGYWEGVGMLWDDGGKDEYQGVWYVQGAAAHYAIGYLQDLAGDDTYVATTNMAMGAGHDFSTGILIDEQGNDRYEAPNLSLGAGNANGIGWFVDVLGDDTYVGRGLTLGSAAETVKGSLRERAICLGLFMDLGGNDRYPAESGWARNVERSARWTDRRNLPSESQVGIFWDR